MNDTQKKLVTIRDEFNTRFVERVDLVEAVLTGLVSGFHTVAIGAPGTAKSQLMRDLTSLIDGGNYFETLLTRFSTPEEFFGVYDLKYMKEEGRYRHITAGMAPEAHIINLEEIFKANHSVLNSLLTLLNERLFKPDASEAPVATPLISAFGSSNELPDGDELWALYDRIHFRVYVNYIQSAAGFVRMLRNPMGPLESDKLTIEELHEAREVVSRVPSEAVAERIAGIRAALQEEGMVVSDRRFKQAATAVQAFAYLNGNDEPADDDYMILQHMLWLYPEQLQKVKRTLLDVVNPASRAVHEFLDQVEDVVSEFNRELRGVPEGEGRKRLQVCLGAWEKLEVLITKSESLRKAHGANPLLDMADSRLQDAVSKVESVTHNAVGMGKV